MILEYFGFTIGSLALEFLLNPFRLLASLCAATILGVACMWICWRMGQLFYRGYRPGFGIAFVALTAGAVTWYSVLVFAAIGHTRTVADALLDGRGPLTWSLPTAAATKACHSVAALLRYTARSGIESFAADCARRVDAASRSAADTSLVAANTWLQERLENHQMVTAVAGVAMVALLLGLPAWRAARQFSRVTGRSPVPS